jgi:anti-anti-sigma factor
MAEKESMKVINLEGSLGIHKAHSIKEEITEAVEKNKKVMINLSHVESIDLSIIQLLYAARRYAEKKKRELHLTGNLQDEVRDSFLIGGFCKQATSDATKLEKELIDFIK